jgi:hypothetical protein
MGLVSLSELRTGMVLEAALFNHKGVMLLPSGTRLTDAHLARFKRWGVRQAAVEGASDAAARLEPALVAAVDRALDEKFILSGDDEIMQEIKRIVRNMTLHDALRRKEERP